MKKPRGNSRELKNDRKFHRESENDTNTDNFNEESKNEKHVNKSENQGVISSLFGRNPEIPSFASRAVKPKSEPVFSTSDFKELTLHPFTVSNLDQNLGLQKLTTVQQKAIPILLNGSDALVRSQTGSGKTLAYALPIVEQLHSIRPKLTRADGIRAVVVVPTRELALQTYEWFVKIVKPFTWIVPGYLIGGEKRKSEKARLRKGITVLIGTPGRLLDHIQHTKALHLDYVKWLILDEADRLLDMGYEKDIGSFVEELNKQSNGAPYQTVLLSATLTNAVERLAGLTLKSPSFVDAAGEELEDDLVIPQSLKQYYVLTPAKLRLVTLSAVVRWKCKQSKMLIFCATQDMVDYHTKLLQYGLTGIEFFKLHGNMTQNERTQVFKTFRAAESGVLLCTVSEAVYFDNTGTSF
ncbi:putative ATP-dependent RNA helicase DDX31 [Blattella germanica]|nr:putative ATP-dependent RNA helicase DDX31 [Blattella germanica]